VETASGPDRDHEEHVDTQKLTLMSYNTIQFNVFCSYKVHDLILLFRCYLGMDFDIRQREAPFSDILSFGLPLLPFLSPF
jgi:hypothetical protein